MRIKLCDLWEEMYDFLYKIDVDNFESKKEMPKLTPDEAETAQNIFWDVLNFAEKYNFITPLKVKAGLINETEIKNFFAAKTSKHAAKTI